MAESSHQIGLIDAQAIAFIKALDKRLCHRRRVCYAICIMGIGLQIILWWVHFVMNEGVPLSLFFNKMVVSVIFPFTPFGILLGVATYIRRNRTPVHRDCMSGYLLCIQGSFYREPYFSRQYRSMNIVTAWVGRIRIYLPYENVAGIPDKGDGVFSYFPYSHLCWEYNGNRVWTQSSQRYL